MANVPHNSEGAHAAHGAHTRHTSPVVVFVILTLFTLLEIGVTLIGLPKEAIVPPLIAIALVKAALVAMYYMHLRYEKLIFTIIFVTPALFAVFFVAVLMLA
jgi:cytochrome c oxidase subunit 4